MEYAGASLTLSGLRNGKGLVFDAANVATFGFLGRAQAEGFEREMADSMRANGFANAKSTLDDFGNSQAPEAQANVWGLVDAFKELTKVDPWANGPKLEDLFDKIAKKSEKTSKSVSLDAARWKAEWSARAERNFTGESDVNKWFDTEKADRRAATRAELGLDGTAQLNDFGGLDIAGQLAMTKPEEEDKGSLLERMGLGKPEEFDAAKSALESLGSVLESFGAAYAMTLQAIGEGEMSAAEIAKKGLSAMIRGIADSLAAKGAAEMVTGTAMLITGNPKGAMHLAAGGVYSAGSIAAYAAASKLGGGSSGGSAQKPSASSGSSGGGSRASSGGGSSGGTGASGGVSERVIVVYGDAFSEDSPRQRQLTAERLVSKALGTTAGSNR
jgi:hypothetical protein